MLNSAECIPLVEHFRGSVCGHACMFHSCKESEIVESVGLFKLSSKYTLTVLDNHELIQTRSAYAYLYPEKATFITSFVVLISIFLLCAKNTATLTLKD